MRQTRFGARILLTGGIVAGSALIAGQVNAVEPCGDFGECKVLVEINASDGDIGFHFLIDGDNLSSLRMHDPTGKPLFKYKVGGPLAEQYLTETFAESAEPLCWPDPDADPDDEIVTLGEFVGRWTPGTYVFAGKSDGETAMGEADLSFDLPAAPADLAYDEATGIISWSPGNDLGECADNAGLAAMVAMGDLPTHPEFVPVAEWEAVFEPEVDDVSLKFSVRVPPGQLSVMVPGDYLAALPADTPAKIEVGAIGFDDNATFSEEGDICVNEDEGCEEEEAAPRRRMR